MSPTSAATLRRRVAGDSYDNALAESVNGLYEAELNPARQPAKIA